jgi:hypothetical protein
VTLHDELRGVLEFKDGTEVQRISKIDGTGKLMTGDFMLVDKNLEAVREGDR